MRLPAAIAARSALFLRYGDQDGGHDTITRYSITPDENGDWLIGITRHWSRWLDQARAHNRRSPALATSPCARWNGRSVGSPGGAGRRTASAK